MIDFSNPPSLHCCSADSLSPHRVARSVRTRASRKKVLPCIKIPGIGIATSAPEARLALWLVIQRFRKPFRFAKTNLLHPRCSGPRHLQIIRQHYCWRNWPPFFCSPLSSPQMGMETFAASFETSCQLVLTLYSTAFRATTLSGLKILCHSRRCKCRARLQVQLRELGRRERAMRGEGLVAKAQPHHHSQPAS